MAAPKEIFELIGRFDNNREAYRSGQYNETQLRREFVDPFFKILGWDINNEKGYAEAYKDVIHEDSIKVGGVTKAPDYCFRIGGTRKFFVETKKPSINLKDDISPAFQLRRYAWSAKLPLSILTDFEELAVYDCRVKPDKSDKSSTARILYLTCAEYTQRWDEIFEIFSRDAVLKGSFDRYAESSKVKKGTASVDDAFLHEIESWRDTLARNLALRNPDLSQRDLNFAVQRTIDRIVFLRICEDRGMEQYGRLMSLQNGDRVYERLCEMFHRADERYNSGLFHFQKEKSRTEPPDTLTIGLIIDDKPLKDIIKNLYYPDSPYEFSVLSADILGQVYEQFLGKVIRLTEGHRAVVEEKPEVRKAGGVYYTPTYIVDYIVKNTVGQLVKSKIQNQKSKIKSITPKDISKIRILDPACGSGSFLLGAYQYLLDWHRDWYVANNPEKWATGKTPALYQSGKSEIRSPKSETDNWRLTTAERRRILLNNIYGVDIDPQAVEVTKLSLLLKVLEGESGQTLARQLKLFHERALPDLGNNIKCGNSLIGTDYYNTPLTPRSTERSRRNLFEGEKMDSHLARGAGGASDEERYRINPFDWETEFPEIMKNGGFDVVIGNPPYLKIEHIQNDDRSYFFKTYKTCMKRYDTYGLFIERSIRILGNNGYFGMIIPSTWLNNLSFGGLRNMLIESTYITSIVNLGGKVFESVNNDTLILLFSKGQKLNSKTRIYDVRDYGAGLASAELIGERDLKKSEPPDYCFELRVSEEANSIIKKMLSLGIRLDDLCQYFQGFVTGSNEAYIITHDTIQREKLEKELCRPAVFGDNVSRYGQPVPESDVIYLTKYNDLDDYPNIRNRLLTFKNQLQKKREVVLGRQPWFSLHWPRVQKNFERSPKILVQCIRNLALKRRVVATLDTEVLYADHTLNVIYTDQDKYDIRYILGILNSNLVNFIFLRKYIDINIKGVYLANIPIRSINFSNPSEKAQHDRMVELVNQMLELHKQLTSAKTDHDKTIIQRQIDATDRQIDQLVYELYGLTEEEINIVEGSLP